MTLRRTSSRVCLVGALVAAVLCSSRPGAGAEGSASGFVAVASAQAMRATVSAPGFLLVEDLVDFGTPVVQAVVEPFAARSFASAPYPGDTAIAAPGLVALAGGPAVPSYPFYVAASTDSPKNEFSDPTGALVLRAVAALGSSSGQAVLRAGGPSATASSVRTAADVTTASDGTMKSVAESVTEGLQLGDVMSIALVRSRSETTQEPNSAASSHSDLIIEGGAAGNLRFSYGPNGLSVAGTAIPIPTDAGLAALNGALGPAGITLRFVATDGVVGGSSARVLEIRQIATLPSGVNSVISYRIGQATTAVTSGVAAPEVPSSPQGASALTDTVGPPDQPDAAVVTGTPSAPLAPGPSARDLPYQPTDGQGAVTSTDMQAATEAASPPSVAPPPAAPLSMYSRRPVGPLRSTYPVVMATPLLLFALYCLWTTRGALRP